MTEELTLERYQEAYRDRRQQEERRGFRVHAVVYACVNAALTVVNLLVVPEFLWFFFPLGGWGIGLTMHYIFGIRRLTRNLEQEEQTLMEEARR